MYHHIVEQAQADERFYEISLHHFERQLDLLKRWGFETVTFDRLLQTLETRAPLPARKPVIITFDDGFTSFAELALPALLSRQMRATVFVPAGYTGSTNSWDSEFPRRSVMTADSLRHISSEGIEIGSHGWLHRDLTLCTKAQVDEELARSKTELERVIGQPIRMFSYPYGRYQPEHFASLATSGYEGAVSIFSDEPSVTNNRFAMRRIYIHEGDTRWRFQFKLSPGYLKYCAWRDSRSRTSLASAI